MIHTAVLALIIALQVSTGLYVAVLCWRARRGRLWMLLPLVLVGLAMRRSIFLLSAIGNTMYTPSQMVAELFVLLILSGILLFGIYMAYTLSQSLERTNRALRESEFTFRTMVENLPGAAYRSKADTDRAMLYISDGIEALTGYPAEDFVNNKARSFGSIIHDKDLSVWYARQKNPTSKAPFEVRYRLQHANGNIIYVQDRGRAVFDAEGNLLWLNGYIWDVSETVQSEEVQLSLERQVQYAQKVRSLGVLSGGVARDFNNLLMAILGHSELAMLDIDPGMPAYESVLEMQQASLRAAQLCEQLLAYSGKGAFEIKRIQLHELVSVMLDLLKTSISKKIHLDIKLPEDLPHVEGDSSQLSQMLMNLIINASEAIGDSKGAISLTGEVLLSAEDIPSGAYLADEMPPGRYVCIEVKDTGCGMSEEVIERIFDPFFTTKSTGRGLGMSAVMGIVRGHKGALWFQTQPGVGTTFRVFLPAAKRKKPSTTFMERDKPDFWKGSGLILLVDDEEALRVVAKKMLEHIGFDVITAANGREALEIFAKKSEDIEAVLLDLNMPEMDGEETFREMKKLDENVKVIVASGCSMQEIEERFEDMGLLGALHKPYSMKVLKKTLRNHLDDMKEEKK